MRTTEKDSVSLIYLVLALGCQYSKEPASNATKNADEFFTRARTACSYDLIDSGDQSLQQIQVRLLMAQYLKSTGSTHKAWGVMGGAIRICQRLGLHLPTTPTASAFPNPVDRELIKRVWHGCLMVERMLCMNLGRPPMVPTSCNNAVPLPLDLDEQDYQSDILPEAHYERESIFAASGGEATMISFFILSVDLYEIVQDILLSFYADETASDRISGYECYFVGPGSIFEIDNKLAKWCSRIPSKLQLDYGATPASTQDEVEKTFRRQAVVLWLRYLQVGISQLRARLT